MPILKCKICSNEFYAKPNWIKKGWGKYCSRKCLHKSQENGMIVECFMCRKEIYRAGQQLQRSKSKKYFCSKSCQTLWRNTVVFIGENHANWRGGESTYRNIISSSKVLPVCKMCKYNDKRILIVHHVEKKRKNNRLNNLVWMCHNCHYLVHHHQVEKIKLKKILAS